jgi:hypothetical protein
VRILGPIVSPQATHVFYAALSPDSDLSVEAARNAAMLGSVLDGLEAVGAPLERVVIYQGFKIYGIHLGARVRTPARESDPARELGLPLRFPGVDSAYDKLAQFMDAGLLARAHLGGRNAESWR